MSSNKATVRLIKHLMSSTDSETEEEACDSGYIWNNPDFQRHFPLLSDKDEEEEQTYAEFVDMGQRPPNAEGTGRFPLTRQRSTIEILDLRTVKNDNRLTDRLSLFLESFFDNQIKVHRSKAPLRFVEGTKDRDPPSIIDGKEQIEFPLTNSCADNGDVLVDVWSILDVLMEYVGKNEYSLVALVDIGIGETCDDSKTAAGIMEVLGRACGDRVAVVNSASNDMEIFGTVAHELLHTMGFDHTCTHWKCLMNPSVVAADEPYCPLFLAPHNLKKLELFLRQQRKRDVTGFLLRRYRCLYSNWNKIFTAADDESSSSDTKESQAQAQIGFLWLERMITFLEQEKLTSAGDGTTETSSRKNLVRENASGGRRRKRVKN